MTPIEERTIALAGVLQASSQVQCLARTGNVEAPCEDIAIQSILTLDAVSTAAVFGGINGIRKGLQMLADGVLISPDGDDLEVLRYTMSLLHLQAQLGRNQRNFEQFSGDVERLSSVQKSELPPECSAIYQQYISKLQPQVIVQGEQDFLQQVDIPPRIRTLLLAGIRAAVLWRQKGGGRFRMLWERTRMRSAAQSLLGGINH